MRDRHKPIVQSDANLHESMTVILSEKSAYLVTQSIAKSTWRAKGEVQKLQKEKQKRKDWRSTINTWTNLARYLATLHVFRLPVTRRRRNSIFKTLPESLVLRKIEKQGVTNHENDFPIFIVHGGSTFQLMCHSNESYWTVHSCGIGIGCKIGQGGSSLCEHSFKNNEQYFPVVLTVLHDLPQVNI